jgi:hypothetical protein
LAPGIYDLEALDCGDEKYNHWLRESAVAAISAGTCAVYALVQRGPNDQPRVMGYFAVSPTQVVRHELPRSLQRGAPRVVPGWLLAKLALSTELQGDRERTWGSGLLVAALDVIVSVADSGGGKVIVVDAEHAGLLDFYAGHDLIPTGRGQPDEADLRLFMKVSTALKALGGEAAAGRD